MCRINPEVFDLHRRRANALRHAAMRAWNPLSWLATRYRRAASFVAHSATKKPSRG